MGFVFFISLFLSLLVWFLEERIPPYLREKT